MKFPNKWWSLLILAIIILIILITFFYPKECGGLIDKKPTWKECTCIGFEGGPLFSSDITVSVTPTYCYGICLKNGCEIKTSNS